MEMRLVQDLYYRFYNRQAKIEEADRGTHTQEVEILLPEPRVQGVSQLASLRITVKL